MNERIKNKERQTNAKRLPKHSQNLTKKHEESKEGRKGTAPKEGGKGNEICNQ
jgi:hypothetical protein|tara:strand:+ start:18 stop:176 length:159 start_codon:yes stop_codon:yes gene_type:complete